MIELWIRLIIIFIRWAFIAISYQNNSYILWMPLWVWAIAWAAIDTIIWILIGSMSTRSSTYFHLFQSTLSAYFWWFLKATHLMHHIAIDISRKLICRTLIWVSNTLILTCWMLSILISRHSMIMFASSCTNIPITLTHSSNCSQSFSISFILVCHELSSSSTIQHCCCILISNCIFSSL